MEKNKNTYMSYLFNHEIRVFFDVDNIYVVKKLALVLFPFYNGGDWKVAVIKKIIIFILKKFLVI
jgi:hypothetical protein